MYNCLRSNARPAKTAMTYLCLKVGFSHLCEGPFDFKRTGTEMSPGKGMNALDNFDQFSIGLLGIYPPGSKEHEWLKIKTVEWNRLARALFEVHCFLRSQKKGIPKNMMTSYMNCGMLGRLPSVCIFK